MHLFTSSVTVLSDQLSKKVQGPLEDKRQKEVYIIDIIGVKHSSLLIAVLCCCIFHLGKTSNNNNILKHRCSTSL